MNTKFKFKGKIITHLLFPILIGIVMMISGISIYFSDATFGIIISVSAFVLIVLSVVMYFVNKPLVMRDLVNFAMDYAQIQKELLHDLALPYGLCDPEGCILWSNKELKSIVGEDIIKSKKIKNYKEVLVLSIDNDGEVYLQAKNRKSETFDVKFSGGNNW